MSAAARFDALVLHVDDDVAVALRDLAVGAEARIRGSAGVESIVLRDAVAVGHKFARRDVAAGAEIRKYGGVIGTATAAIPRGAHVHVHNLVSRRARARAPG